MGGLCASVVMVVARRGWWLRLRRRGPQGVVRCSVGAGSGRSVLVRVCGSVGSWCCGDPGWLVREV